MPTLKEAVQYFSDPIDVSNKFNKFFTTLSSNSTVNINKSLTKIDEIYKDIKSNNIYTEMNFVEVSEKCVEKLINELDISNGAGISDIPTKVIKSCACLIPVLTNLFNKCIKTASILNEWKTAIVTPLFKNKGYKTDQNNYRGILIISPLAKVFEKILASQIKVHLKLNDNLFDGQHGFHSCESALHELISNLNKSRGNKLTSLLLFIDFKKAFDLVDSSILL